MSQFTDQESDEKLVIVQKYVLLNSKKIYMP